MASFCQAAFALIGLATVLVIGWQWLLDRAGAALQPDDVLRRIDERWYAARDRIREEELRHQAKQWARSNTLPPEPWRGRR